jgi:hypothetical protein
MKTLRSFLLIAIISGFVLPSRAQVSVGDVYPGKIGYAAFTISHPEKIKINGTAGGFYDDGRFLVYYGWIIDSETRKVAWHMFDKYERDDFEDGEFEFKDEVSLNKGTYELYFAGARHQWNDGWNDIGNFSDFIGNVFGDRSTVKFRSSKQELMEISLSGSAISKIKMVELLNSKTSASIVSLLKPDHNANEKKGFSLSAETTLRIYAIGEGRDDSFFDYAWIYDVNKRKRVWEMDFHNTDFAGGNKKNLVADEKIKLPAGDYLVSYVTDDSHAFDEWNTMPPDDPHFTGITIWANSEQDKKNVVPFTLPAEVKPVLQITKVRDDDFKSQGLSVKAPVELRILCMGEESGDDMADYGWIMNASTREIVWDMNRERNMHAGGADKNRMVEGTVRLDKGEFIVYYSTDDSHSYADWNSGPPHEQDYYGITLWVSKKEDLSKVSLFEPGTYKNDKVVVEIVQVRDDERLNESFTLDKDTKLRVFALGEGDDGDMVDYGWIKNTETGKVVWEMTYRNTENAGGAKKNRVYNDTIILPKGTYRIYYETDGSHSYRRWNASPPHGQEKYGISLYKELN